MLTSLSIGNFKAFGETQTIPIRPITLIFGANSSGKSSIIHSLLLANHALETGNWSVHRTAQGGDSMDLGGFGAYVHRHDLATPVTLGFGLSTAEDRLDTHLSLRVGTSVSLRLDIGSEVDNLGNRLREGAPSILRGSLRVGEGEPVNFVNRRSKSVLETLDSDNEGALLEWDRGGYSVDCLQADHPAANGLAGPRESRRDESLVLRDVPRHRASLEWQRPYVDVSLEIGAGDLIPCRLKYFGKDEDLKAQLFRPSLPDNAVDPRCRVIRSLEHLVQDVNRVVSDDLKTLQYLGPLRSFPARYFELEDSNDPNWAAGGASAWDVLRLDDAIRTKVNEWLGTKWLQTPYDLTTKSFLNLEAARRAIADELFALREDFPRKEQFKTEEPAAELVDLLLRNGSLEWRRSLALQDRCNGTTVSHRDVGLGISQVIPVLVHSCAGKKKLVAIEQPELHLHPAMQAELGDVFIESALGERKNTFLLETHSEHLILRIMRRIRETHLGKLPKEKNLPPVRPSDVAVLYVEKQGPRSIVREFPLNERGELVKAWPGGFFEEDLREVLG